MGPNNWGIFLIWPVTTGEGIGPAGEISPVVCMLKNGLALLHNSHSLPRNGPGMERKGSYETYRISP